MAADPSRAELDQITRAIIGAAQVVSSRLGPGFLEKVYENALAVELRRRALRVDQQRPVHVRYGEEIVGEYVTDLLVEGAVIVEVKAVAALCEIHHAQCLNYLRATGHRACLLMNFGHSHMRFRRIVNGF
jgi:GxxExxY protein